MPRYEKHKVILEGISIQRGASNEHSTSLSISTVLVFLGGFFLPSVLELAHFPGPGIHSPRVSEQKDVQVFSCVSRADLSLKAAF